jgi:hypothetical protein
LRAIARRTITARTITSRSAAIRTRILPVPAGSRFWPVPLGGRPPTARSRRPAASGRPWAPARSLRRAGGRTACLRCAAASPGTALTATGAYAAVFGHFASLSHANQPPASAHHSIQTSEEGRSTSSGATLFKHVRRCPTLPRGPPRSTIGAEGLNFRVRDGTGCFPFAITAETLLRCHRRPSREGNLPGDRISGTA